jgi:hypothetical protein
MDAAILSEGPSQISVKTEHIRRSHNSESNKHNLQEKSHGSFLLVFAPAMQLGLYVKFVNISSLKASKISNNMLKIFVFRIEYTCILYIFTFVLYTKVSPAHILDCIGAMVE